MCAAKLLYLEGVLAGNVLTVVKYRYPKIVNPRQHRRVFPITKPSKTPENELIRASERRTRKNIKNLCNQNWTPRSLFVNLTFKKELDITNQTRLFNNYIKKLNRKSGSKIPFLVVFECFPNNRFHIHGVFFDTTLNTDIIMHHWKHGISKVEKIDPIRRCTAIGNYLVKSLKYRKEGRFMWKRSRNLKKPTTFWNESMESYLKIHNIELGAGKEVWRPFSPNCTIWEVIVHDTYNTCSTVQLMDINNTENDHTNCSLVEI